MASGPQFESGGVGNVDGMGGRVRESIVLTPCRNRTGFKKSAGRR